MPISSKKIAAAAIQLAAAAAAALLASCGGGSSNPLDNPEAVENPPVTGGQRLSFAYFQKCINPIFIAQLPVQISGSTATNTCAGSGCHAATTGTGGAFRIVPAAATVDLTAAADTIRVSDMYKNFYSAQGEVVVGSPSQSRLLLKPQLLNVLHGGGLIFASASDPNVQTITYWISHPEPQGQDEFSTATYSAYFTAADPINGSCLTQ
jgi:hypothetical protein